MKFKILSLFIFMCIISTSNAQSYNDLWKEIDSCLNNNLPKSAEKYLDEIQNSASKENDYHQLLKCMLKRFKVFELNDEQPIITSINYAKNYSKSLNAISKALSDITIAEMYNSYLMRNQYIIDGNKTTGNSDDIRFWDKKTFHKEILKEYENALKESDVLKTTNIDFLDGILDTVINNTLEPTLYDYVMHKYINYLKNNINNIDNQYIIDILKSNDITTALLDNNDNEINTIIHNYQELITLNRSNDHYDAAIFNETECLNFLYNLLDESHSDEHLAALQSLTDRYSKNNIAPIIKEQINILIKQINSNSEKYGNNYIKIMSLCKELKEKYPDSEETKGIDDLIENITRPELGIDIDNILLPGKDIALGLNYRNIDNIQYKIYKINVEEYFEIPNPSLLVEKYNYFNERKPYKEGTINLVKEDDFREHSTLEALPPLETGFYYIVFLPNGNFDKNNINSTVLQVSRLSSYYYNENNGTVFRVVDRLTGKAIQDADIQLYTREYDYKKKSYEKKYIGNTKTDKEGIFRTDKNCYVIMSLKGDTLISENLIYNRPVYKNNPTEKTYFFSDRRAFRPGQTIKFKGVMIENNGSEKELITGRETTVAMIGANGEVITRQSYITDSYGAFNGSFVIPDNIMNGMFIINNESGNLSFTVAEYKRPTFEVTFNDLTSQYSLNDEVSIEGKVMTYSGRACDGAKISYTVIREVILPYKFGRIMSLPEEEQIAFGETTTDKNGTFKIDFKLIPQTTAMPQMMPQFIYKINVNATDKAGETQSAITQISASYSKIRILCDVKENIEKHNLKNYEIEILNNDGKKTNATLYRKIYHIKDGNKIRIDNKYDRKTLSEEQLDKMFPLYDYYPDKEEETLVYEDVIQVDGSMEALPEALENMQDGRYVMKLTSVEDSIASINVDFILYDEDSRKMPCHTILWAENDVVTAKPGQKLQFLLGSSFENSTVYIMIHHGEESRINKSVKVSNSVAAIDYEVTEKDRGSLRFDAIIIRHNEYRCYTHIIAVPYDNLDLDIQIDVNREVLLPGTLETWNISVKDFQGKGVSASILADMYDASLDKIESNNWNFNIRPYLRSFSGFNCSPFFRSTINPLFSNLYIYPSWTSLTSGISLTPFSNYYLRTAPMLLSKTTIAKNNRLNADETQSEYVISDSSMSVEEEKSYNEVSSNVRDNFEETAFFYPSIISDADGNASISFTMPDALTRWRLMMMAYTKDLKSGIINQYFTTSKPVTIKANMPRFCRHGDTLKISAIVANNSEETIKPSVKLDIYDALNMKPLSLLTSVSNPDIPEIEAGGSHAAEWEIAIDDKHSLLVLRFTVSTEGFSDAEQHLLPVLDSKVLLTQTLPITVMPNSQSTINLEKMKRRKDEQNISATLNFSANPVWYAVLALPYLHDINDQYTETTFYKLYTNSLSVFLASKTPNLVNYIKTWKVDSPETLLSQLEKDKELKNIMLQETPWVIDAKNESAQRARIAALFDINTINNELNVSINKLLETQTVNGGWAWIEGMPENKYVTSYILSGLGKMKNIGVIDSFNENDKNKINKICENACRYLYNELVYAYNKLSEKEKNNLHVRDNTLSQLYALSFFDDGTAGIEARTVRDNYITALKKDWKDLDITSQAQAALILWRNGDKNTAGLIVKSLSERAQHNELGMYWRNSNTSTQAQIMEAYNEIGYNAEEMEQMKLWLLTQKRSNMWENNRSTVDAIYALLMNGEDMFNDGNVSLSGGNINVEGSEGEAGTGFITKTWTGNEIDNLNTITVNNDSPHIAWGGMFRQYLVPADKVKAADNSLTINRKYYIERYSVDGTKLIPAEQETVKEGDILVVQLTVKCKQDMEFVVLNDMYAACFEPEEQISSYKYNNGLYYYFSPSDSNVTMYFNTLPKGEYQLYYKVYITREGYFNAGFADIQCLYAPEFRAYSKGENIIVK